MMGGAAPGIPAPTQPAVQSYVAPTATASQQGELEVPGLGSRRRSGGVGRAVLLGLVVFGALAGGAVGLQRYLATRQTAAQTLPAIVQSSPDGSLALVVTLRGAAPGTSLRIPGRDPVSVSAEGTATLPLALGPEQVGTITQSLEEIAPGGVVRRHEARFVVGYRVETDLQLLGEEPPRVHLRFHVPEGAQLFVSGQPIRVERGVGVAELPGPAPSDLDTPGEGTRQRFPLRVVVAEGTEITSEYELRVPRLPLTVTAPGRLASLNAPTAVVTGSAQGATRVRVGGIEVRPAEGQFRAEVPLQNGANSVDVIAYGAGAPVKVRLSLYNNVTAEQYLSLGGGNAGAAALVGTGVVGRRLQAQGTVLSDPTDAQGVRAVQLRVLDRQCPGGQCVTWVDLPASATVRRGDTVRVVGEVIGARAYRTQSGDRRNDPVLRAFSVNGA